MPQVRPVVAGARRDQDWRALLAVFWITSMVEGLGVSQIFALLPAYLRDMGVVETDRLAFVGLFSALIRGGCPLCRSGVPGPTAAAMRSSAVRQSRVVFAVWPLARAVAARRVDALIGFSWATPVMLADPQTADGRLGRRSRCSVPGADRLRRYPVLADSP
jgi:hypothetical protein